MLKRVFTLICFIMLLLPLSAQALIQNEAQAYNKIESINQLATFDFSGLFNQSELVGMKYTNYSISTTQYKQSVAYTAGSIKSLLSQKSIVDASDDISPAEKLVQAQKIYQEIDAALYGLDSQSLSYLYSLRLIMPTITYQRFVKKFEQYYNTLNITDNQLKLN